MDFKIEHGLDDLELNLIQRGEKLSQTMLLPIHRNTDALQFQRLSDIKQIGVA